MKPDNVSLPTLLGLAVAYGAATAQPPGEPGDGPSPEIRLDALVAGEGGTPAGMRRVRDALIGIEEFNSALAPAEELVSELRSDNSRELARDILQLAVIQTALEMFDEAELRYLEGLQMLADVEGELSVALVDPYHALGISYIRSARYPEAIAALEQAQHLSQRNLGLFNVEQARLLDDMTTAYLGLGDTATAHRLQQTRLTNAVRRYGADDPRVIPFHYQLAEYYERSRMRISARRQYTEILEILEAGQGSTDASLLAPLREIVAIDLAVGETNRNRDRLSEVLAANPDAGAAERALSFALLGDWALMERDPDAARDYYREAYRTAERDPDADAEQLFGQPVMIDFVAPLTAVDRYTRSRPYNWGMIVMGFTVSADGRPWNVEVLSDDPPGLMETAYIRRLRETSFRPRLVDGEPVQTDNVQFTHRFRYYVDD